MLTHVGIIEVVEYPKPAELLRGKGVFLLAVRDCTPDGSFGDDLPQKGDRVRVTTERVEPERVTGDQRSGAA